jgi:DNA mismatch repair ATPase MutS
MLYLYHQKKERYTKMDFSRMTDAELRKINEELTTEITRRAEIEKELAREELEKLLNRVNELQEKYDFEIECYDIYDNWVDYAHDFGFRG